MGNRVVFKEVGHEYIDTQDSCRYTSVTTVIDKFIEPFDKEYWGTYKALKDTLTLSGEWYNYKKQAGGWDMVVDYYNRSGAPCSAAVVEVRKMQYFDKWDKTSKEALKVGSAVHYDKEMELLDAGAITFRGEKLSCHAGNTDDIDKMSEIEDGAFAELLMYNAKYRIAGQADLVYKKGKDVWIYDYKTNKEISTSAFMDKTMLYPLNDIPDTTLNHYMLQLSFYGWMLEDRGYNVRGLVIKHLDRKTGEDIAVIPLDYRPELIKKLLFVWESMERTNI